MKVRILRNLADPSKLREGEEADLKQKEAEALIARGLAVSLEKAQPANYEAEELEAVPPVESEDASPGLKTGGASKTAAKKPRK